MKKVILPLLLTAATLASAQASDSALNQSYSEELSTFSTFSDDSDRILAGEMTASNIGMEISANEIITINCNRNPLYDYEWKIETAKGKDVTDSIGLIHSSTSTTARISFSQGGIYTVFLDIYTSGGEYECSYYYNVYVN